MNAALNITEYLFMRLMRTSLALACVTLVAACGSGGDSSSTGNNTGGGSGTSSSSNVTMAGVASKGLMANATVTVHAVKSDGTIDPTPLQTTTTDSSGHYTLSFTGTKDQPYVVRVAAKSDGSTTHLDEVTGQSQALPANFVMRALFVPTQTGNVTTSATVTPFSEMAVAAAASASGGVTAANAAQAVSTVSQLLGFDPTAADLSAADSDVNKQKLKVLLTAVSQMANDSALGCSTGAAGDKVKCVVEQMAAATHTDSLQLTSGSGGSTVNVSGALQGALTTVLADDSLTGSVDPSLFAVVNQNLACTTSCTPATSTTGTAAAITAAKTLFTQLKSDWMSLFTRTDAATLGGVNVQANEFVAALQDVHVPAETLIKDTGALILGETLYRQYHAGRTTSIRMGRGDEDLITRGSGSVPATNYRAIGCTLYQDVNSTTEATSPSNANYVGCRATYYYTSTNGTTVTEWRHGFTMTPVNSGASFTYSTRARTGTTALQPNVAAFTGTYTPALNNGELVGFALSGELPGAFVAGSNTLANHKHAVNLTGSVASSGGLSLAGGITAYSDASTVAGTLAIDTGTLTVVSLPGGDVTASAAELAISWTTAGAKVQGSFGFNTPVTDADGVSTVPTHAFLSGTLSTVINNVATPFIQGSVTSQVIGYGTYHSLQASGANNAFDTVLTFAGEVSAPNRPKLQLTLAGTVNSATDVQGIDTLDLQYRSFASGSSTPSLTLAGTVTRVRNGDSSSASVTLLETGSNVKVTWSPSTQQVNVKQGDTVIGVLDPRTRLLTFSDGTFQSVDVGL